MARHLIRFGICSALFVSLLILLAGCATENQTAASSIKILAEGKEIIVQTELATTESEIIKGLMGRTNLSADSGMLFIFPDEKFRSFWMKNTLISLDIIFVSGNGTIIDIKEGFAPCKKDPCESYKSKEKAKYVLEVNAGFARENGIHEGDFVSVNQ